jgi:membrane-associated phospholipid phosphatase
MLYAYGTANRLLFEHGWDANPPQAARVLAALSVAHYDAWVACYEAKYFYWSPRPFHVDPEFKSMIPSPSHPSYPSGHSCQGAAVAGVLASFFPGDKEALDNAVVEAGNSRMWAGIHFQSDIDAGQTLGYGVAELVAERAETMTSQ